METGKHFAATFPHGHQIENLDECTHQFNYVIKGASSGLRKFLVTKNPLK